MNLITNQEKIKSKLEEIVKRKGAELVEFKIFKGDKIILRCLVDFPQGGITIDDCSNINREFFSFLDKNELIEGNFIVEVNSPGLTRPLRTQQDFLRVKGKRIGVWLKEPFKEKNYFEGELLKADKGKIFLCDKNNHTIELLLSQINLGKVIL